MKSTEETQPQILMQQTPMHCIQSAFEPYLITSGRCFGTTCTIIRTNTTACAVSPISTSLASPSVGRRTCTTGSGCTLTFGSQQSKSHTGGQENGLVSKRVLCYASKLSLWNFDISYIYVGWSLRTCSVLAYLETTAVNSFEKSRWWMLNTFQPAFV